MVFFALTVAHVFLKLAMVQDALFFLYGGEVNFLFRNLFIIFHVDFNFT